MTDTPLLALLDTLLPGDAKLPAFSSAEIDPAPLAASVAPILTAIDQAAFLRETPAARVALVQRIERDSPEAFRAFLAQALAAYYQAPSVLAALDWRSAPPQPMGHRLSPGDEAAWQGLEKVRQRGRLWR